MKQKLRAGTSLLFEDVLVTLTQDTVVDFVGIDTIDLIAEHLAQNPTAYALHREELSHEEEGVRLVEGVKKTVRISVSYGANGVRQEVIGREIATPSRAVKVVAPDQSSDANN